MHLLSPHLARFETFIEKFPGQHIEIPGQYTGKCCPEPLLHIRITSFGNRVQVMQSLRRPKAVVMMGNDHREHKFLVKFGEDLRLDQRIESLFGIMDQTLTQDAVCSRRALRIVQYSIIPLSKRIGVLSWLPNSTPLKALMGDKYAFGYSAWEREIQTIWSLKKKDPFPQPGTFFQCTLADKEFLKNPQLMPDAFTAVQARVPDDALRVGLRDHCASMEAFLSVRQTFCSSFAALTMALFVLSVGDRHFDNFMLLKDSGQVAGIDFGAAFGQAQNLQVPELMPVRLTQQLRAMMYPLDTLNLLKRGTYISS
jgi:DNA-dependent protein kinase catalytic subunit